MTRGTEIAYVTADGKYAISGDLYDLTVERQSHRDAPARGAR